MDTDGGSQQSWGRDGVLPNHLEANSPATPAKFRRRSVPKREGEVNIALRCYKRRNSKETSENLEGPPTIWTDIPVHTVDSHQNAILPNSATPSSQLAFVEAGNGHRISCSHHRMLLNGEVSLNIQYTADPNTLHEIRSNSSLVGFAPITPGKNKVDVHAPEVTDLLNKKINGRDQQKNVAVMAGKAPEGMFLSQCTSINKADAGFDKTASGSLAPVTPGKSKATQTDQHQVDNTKELQEENCINTSLKDPAECAELSSGLPSQLQIQEDQNVDYSKMPLQKPRKKKHRPKVIQEVKPSRGKKPVNPKFQLTEEGLPRQRRKYVRRKGVNVDGKLSSQAGETAQPIEDNVQKTVKRSLNFDSEVTMPESFGDCSLGSKGETISPNQNVGSNSVIASQGLGEVVNPSVKVASSSSQHTLDTNNSHEFSVTTQISRRLLLKENLKALARERDRSSCQCLVPSNLQAIPAATPEIRRNKRSKRGRNTCMSDPQGSHVSWKVDECALTRSSNELNNIKDRHCNDNLQFSFVQKIFKRKRTKSVRGKVGMNASISASILENRDQNNNIHNVYHFAGVQRFSFFGKWQGNEHLLTCNSREFKSMGHPSVALVEDGDCMTTNTRFNQNEVQLPSQKPNSFDFTHGSSLTETATETATENQLFKTPQKRRAKKDNRNGANRISFDYIQSSKAIRKENLRLLKRFSRASIPDLVDFIVQKLKFLHISLPTGTMTQYLLEENAIVPYSGGGMIVPFDVTFGIPRRKKARAKVDLDSETNRVWMLLMGKDAADGPQGTDTEKEHWWEEERRVFRGRTDSFIARMHLIQGDRRFSPWKGSVVDSVVGVFLTQNVSDHASSSAFMAIAGRFPASSRGKNSHNAPEAYLNVDGDDRLDVNIDKCTGPKEKILNQQEFAPHSTVLPDPQHVEINIMTEQELPGRSSTNNILCYTDDKHIDVSGNCTKCSVSVPIERIDSSHELKETQCEMNVLNENISCQTSFISSPSSSNSLYEASIKRGPCSKLNFGVKYSVSENKWNKLDTSTSFTDLLQMAESRMLKEISSNKGTFFSFTENASSNLAESGAAQTPCPVPNDPCKLDNVRIDLEEPASQLPFGPGDLTTGSETSTISHTSGECDSEPGIVDDTVIDNENKSFLAAYATRTNENSNIENFCPLMCVCEEKVRNSSCQENPEVSHLRTSTNYSCKRTGSGLILPSEAKVMFEKISCGSSCLQSIGVEPSTSIGNINELEKVQDMPAVSYQNRETDFKEHTKVCLVQMPNGKLQQSHTGHNCSSTSNIAKTSCSGVLEDRGCKPIHESSKVNMNQGTVSKEKPKRRKHEKKGAAFDWESLRRQTCGTCVKNERSKDKLDSVDWEAVRCADVSEVSSTIRDRGMNNVLAERIKDFLDRLVREHGSIDLEWLRDVPPDRAKDYLLSIRGLGLKSVECVRLLTLRHLAFPVDTNVGRICVRLGWVPLQPLPESLQLHLLELYPVLETIQKYLWPRLCNLDQQTLYELHYQMITFGKVFCTKSKPNCNSCPMRAECRHFASAFASARLALPGPEEKSLVSSTIPAMGETILKPTIHIMSLPQLEGNSLPKQDSNRAISLMPPPLHENIPISKLITPKQCEPIIEEPVSPEPECLEILERDIEDAFFEDPDEIPTIKLNIEQFAQNLQTIFQENNMELQDADMSKALVALTPEATSIPQPKLKNVNRLRTEHQVYELPDSHPLLEELDKREPDDPCPYLLAIWTPGETAESTESPETSCKFGDPSKLCDNTMCFACSSIREARAQKVRGTLLIPCRTAMRGSFPLNGTYFQVNEVFADHASSLCPIDVPREWIWNLPRRTVFFGTSISTIFRGLTTETIQHCFWRGFVCVRAFDQKTRAPRPLMARLHFPASKITKAKKTNTNQE